MEQKVQKKENYFLIGVVRNETQEFISVKINGKWRLMSSHNVGEKSYQMAMKRSSFLSKNQRKLIAALLYRHSDEKHPIKEGYYTFSPESNTLVNAASVVIALENEKYIISFGAKGSVVPFFSIEKKNKKIKLLLNNVENDKIEGTLLQYCFNDLSTSLSKQIQNGEDIEGIYIYPFHFIFSILDSQNLTNNK